jgi:D-alanyl-D-alanine carboxypeptidase
LPAPVAAGDVVGEAVYFYGGQEVGTVPLVAAETVNRSNFTQTLEKMSTLWVQ